MDEAWWIKELGRQTAERNKLKRRGDAYKEKASADALDRNYWRDLAEKAEADIAYAVKHAKEYCPHYPWQLNTASEVMWALGEGYKGVEKACDDWMAKCKKAEAERDVYRDETASCHERIEAAEADAARCRAGIEKVIGYNRDCQDEKINYRPYDHIAVLSACLRGELAATAPTNTSEWPWSGINVVESDGPHELPDMLPKGARILITIPNADGKMLVNGEPAHAWTIKVGKDVPLMPPHQQPGGEQPPQPKGDAEVKPPEDIPAPPPVRQGQEAAKATPAPLPGSATVIGGWWKHYKGGVYEVVGTCTIEKTCEPGVLYRGHDGRTWLRPLAEWHEIIDVESPSRPVPRFVQIATPPLPEPPKCPICHYTSSEGIHAATCPHRPDHLPGCPLTGIPVHLASCACPIAPADPNALWNGPWFVSGPKTNNGRYDVRTAYENGFCGDVCHDVAEWVAKEIVAAHNLTLTPPADPNRGRVSGAGHGLR